MIESENHKGTLVTGGYGQAIETKYLGPTNSRGARVKATCQAKSATVSWDYALNSQGNHEAAALALVHSMIAKGGEGWKGAWHGGQRPCGTGYVFSKVER